jgi:hypothetical protein
MRDVNILAYGNQLVSLVYKSPLCAGFRITLQIVLLGLAFCLLTACIISRHPHVINSSTKPISPNYVVLASVEDTSCSPWFLFIPLGGRASGEEIMANLVQENGADALVGVTIEHRESLFSLPILGSDCTIVKAQAVKVVE